MAHVHQAGIEWTLTPENWSGRVEVITALDGRVTNRGVARYRELEGRHLDPVSPRTFGAEVIALKVQTRQSNLYVAEAARTRAYRSENLIEVERSLYQMEDYIQHPSPRRAPREPCASEDGLLYTSHVPRHHERWASPGIRRRYPSFAEALDRHGRSWKLLGLCDLAPRNARVQLLCALHLPHLPVCSRHTATWTQGARPASTARRTAVYLLVRSTSTPSSLFAARIPRDCSFPLPRLVSPGCALVGFGLDVPVASGTTARRDPTVHLNPLRAVEPDLIHN